MRCGGGCSCLAPTAPGMALRQHIHLELAFRLMEPANWSRFLSEDAGGAKDRLRGQLTSRGSLSFSLLTRTLN